MDDTKHAFRSVWVGVMEYVLPPLTWMLEKFQTVAIFMRKHSDFIVGLMVVIGTAIGVYVIPPLLAMGAAVVVAFAPFILAGAIIAALGVAFALLYEDVMTFLDGGDSMLGQILNKWPMIGDIARGIGTALKALFDAGITVAEFFGNMWANPTKAFKQFFDFLWGGIKALINAIPGLGSVLNALGLGQVAIAQSASSPLNSQSSTSITNSSTGGKSTNVQIGKVEVQTQATDAAGISKAIGGSMQAQMRQAAANYDDGVAA
jgi:hypothetical protein